MEEEDKLVKCIRTFTECNGKRTINDDDDDDDDDE